MRVLHILDHSIPLHSGYSFRTLAILKQQRELGWESFQLTGPRQLTAADGEETVDGWQFYRTGVQSGPLASLPVIGQLATIRSIERRLAELVDRIMPDVLHAHSPVLNAIAALRVGSARGIPVVYEVRAFWEDAAVDHGTSTPGGLRYRGTRWLETWALKRADAVTTICEGLKQDMVARGIASEKITVIPNAVDIAQFGAGRAPDAELKQQLGLGGGIILGFIGSFYAYEGLPILLRALPQLLRHHPAVHVLIVGGGRQENELKQLAADLGVQNHVVFAGRVPHDDVRRYYDLVDILVYPRLSMRLTELVTPLKPLEAMASQRLLVASDVGGHRELIRAGETGTLFKAGDPASLATVVLDLLEHPERWPALRSAGRKYVEHERTWHSSVARYRHVYGPLVGEGAP